MAPVSWRSTLQPSADRGADASFDAGFEDLYRRFAPVVHGIAVAYVGVDDADDVTQEAFLAVHRGRSDVRESDRVAGWVSTVARNAAIDWLRRRGRRTAGQRSLAEIVATSEGDPDRELARRVMVLSVASIDSERAGCSASSTWGPRGVP